MEAHLEIEQDVRALAERGAGILVWRVNQLKLERVKNEEIGIFYKGDCYDILYLGKGGCFIHYWQGSESSQDEQAFCAMMAVELDDLLGGRAVQIREVNGFDRNKRPLETPRFLKMFNGNYVIKSGGHKTALRCVSKINEPAHLYKVKGKTRPVVSEVVSRTSSLTSGDCFILDVSRKHNRCFCLHGRKSNKKEATKAIQMAGKFGVPVTIIAENEIDTCEEEERKIIQKSLGVSLSRPVKFEGLDKNDDEECEKEADKSLELCQVHDDTISIVPVKQSSLDSGDCFVLKSATKVYVWKGRYSSKEEKKNANKTAEDYIKRKGMPKNTQITIVPENIEPVDFKACFADWKEKDEVDHHDLSRPAVRGNVAKSVHTVIDFRTLYEKPKPKETRDTYVEDDADNGEGKTTIYRVATGQDGNRIDRVLENRDGFVFNSADSYVIVYVYRSIRARKNERALIYYWIGNDSEQLEHGAAAVMASKVDDIEFGGEAVQIRVAEAKEPHHFMKIFGGYIMIRQEHHQDCDSGSRLFHIKGKVGNIRVVEVHVDASNLDTNDCFVLKTPQKKVYIWHGRGSLGDEQRIAHEAAESMFGTSCEFTKIIEGKTETAAFWEAIGDKNREKKYQDQVFSDDTAKCYAAREPRLFRLYNIRGSLEAEEIYDFVQDDLDGDDVFILDTFTSIYLWIGKDCRKDEKTMAIKNLQNFLKDDSTRRDADHLQIQTICQGYEPEFFKDCFGVWEKHRVKTMTLEDMKRLRMEENKMISAKPQHRNHASTYPYDVLKLPSDELPEDVDTAEKESYLTDADFVSVFAQEKEDFYRLPKWKQDQMKKAANLF